MVAMQAVAEDPTTASLLGINADRFIVLTFYQQFSSGLAGTLVGSSEYCRTILRYFF